MNGYPVIKRDDPEYATFKLIHISPEAPSVIFLALDPQRMLIGIDVH